MIGRLTPGGTSTACPDCGTRAVGCHLTHDDTCPLNRAAHARMAADRRFFAEHPGAAQYVRPIQRDEVAELQLSGVIPPGWDAAGDITVTQLRPGLRTRRFDAVWIFSRGDRMRGRSAFEAKCFRLADKALATGDVATDGDLVAVPDIKLVEFAAQGHNVQPAPRLVRGDGRTVSFYRRGAA